MPEFDRQIQLPEYSGPLDLLLHLIEREELNVTAISLAAVSEQYLAKVDQLVKNKVDHLMDFLVIGARLVLIKSRALLPQIPSMYAEEEEDPAESLARQLRLYRQFKNVAQWLQERQAKGLRSYLRLAPPPLLDAKVDLEGITTETLAAAAVSALSRTAQLEESVAVASRPRNITIDDQIRRLRENLKAAGRVFFSELLSERTTLLEVSVSLLAVLELIKRREAVVFQPVSFGVIEIVAESSLGNKTPIVSEPFVEFQDN